MSKRVVHCHGGGGRSERQHQFLRRGDPEKGMCVHVCSCVFMCVHVFCVFCVFMCYVFVCFFMFFFFMVVFFSRVLFLFMCCGLSFHVCGWCTVVFCHMVVLLLYGCPQGDASLSSLADSSPMDTSGVSNTKRRAVPEAVVRRNVYTTLPVSCTYTSAFFLLAHKGLFRIVGGGGRRGGGGGGGGRN